MKGNVYHFNGRHGMAIGEDGVKYYVGSQHFDNTEHSLASNRRRMSKADKDHPVEIEFEPGTHDDPKRRPPALHIRITKTAGFQPERTLDGYWLPANKGDKDVRCSSCGHTASFRYKFCPHCGVPMTGENPNNAFVSVVPSVATDVTHKKGDNMLENFQPEKERDHIVSWLKQWFSENGTAGTVAVLGISGGKDSTIAAALCARALGPERVLGVLMPDIKQDDIQDSYDVVNALGIKSVVANIGPITNSIYATIVGARDCDNKYLGLDFSTDAQINTPPRVRMTMLYAIAASLPDGGRVINTCNRSEDFVGYDTKFGDAAGDVSPLSDYTVTELLAIGRTMPEIPERLVAKTPSDGLCGKSDEEKFGFPYAMLDEYLLNGTEVDAAEKIEAMHEAALHKLRPMPVCPKIENTTLEEPLSQEYMKEAIQKGDIYQSGVVYVDLYDIVSLPEETLLRHFSRLLTGTDMATDVSGKIIGYDADSDNLLVRVGGDISCCVN